MDSKANLVEVNCGAGYDQIASPSLGLTMASVFEEKAKLEAKIKEDQSKLEQLEKESKIAARSGHDELIKAHGFSLQELYPEHFAKSSTAAKTAKTATGEKVDGRRVKGKKRPAHVIYRNPDDASQTWKGRGIAPAWLLEAVKRGAIESFLVPGASHTKKIGELAAKKAGKAAKKAAPEKKAAKKAVKKSVAKKVPGKKVAAKKTVAKKVAVKKATKKLPHIAPKAPIE